MNRLALVLLACAIPLCGSPPIRAEPAPARPLVTLNTADRAQLETLPGIGPAKAAGILAWRQKLGGRFPRIVDLRRVKGIGRKTVERLKPYLILDPPATPPKK